MLTQCSNPSRRCCRSWKLAFLPAAVLCCVLVFGGSGVSLLYAQTPNLSAKEAKREWIYARQAEAWGAFYAGRHQEAMNLLTPLIKLPFEWAAVEAMHCQARCYWSMGASNPRHRAAAKAIWDRLKKASTLTANLQRLKIAKALQSEARTKVDKSPAADADRKESAAIELLEDVLKEAFPDTCTAEAAIELARMYAESRRFDEAARAYDFATRFLEHQQKLELSPAAAAPFVKAAADGKTNLAYLRDTGRRLFETAEGLRRQGKFAEAIRTYRAVIRKHAQTDYAPRSELHIGHCLLGIGRVDQALLCWLQLIQDAPSGPWRGQAYLALIDVYLERRLDIGHAAQYAHMARDSLSSALADKTAATSWQPAAFDICLRSGIVAFIQGQQQAAAAAFEAALQGAESLPAETRAGLERLLAAARDDKSLLPEDVRSPGGPSGGSGVSSQAATALAIGSIYRLSSRLDKAEAFFVGVAPMPRKASRDAARPAAVKIRQANPAQQAFAIYSLAMIAQASGQTDAAFQGYLASLKAHPAGSWHDATLYCIAGIIEGRAKAKYGSPASSAASAGDAASTKANRIKRPSAADRAKAAAAERARLAAYRQARCEALPYWRQLIKGFPESPYAEPAMYNVGVLLYETEQFAEAAELLNRFVAAYPKSLWAGDAYVKLIDVALERMFDLPAAQSLVPKGIQWVRGIKEDSDADGQSACPLKQELAIWRPSFEAVETVNLKLTAYRLYLRAGLAAYAADDLVDAAAWFRLADKCDPPRPYQVVHGQVPSGVERLAAWASSGERLTPDEVKDGEGRFGMMLTLGDLYFHAEDWLKARRLYHFVYDYKPAKDVTAAQKSYAAFMIARTHFWKFEFQEANFYYHVVFEKYPKAPWADKALLYNATMTYSNLQDMEEAVVCLKAIKKDYPGGEMAERATYLIGQFHEWDKNWPEAYRAYQEYLSKYPKGMYAGNMRETHLPKVEAGLKQMLKNRHSQQ